MDIASRRYYFEDGVQFIVAVNSDDLQKVESESGKDDDVFDPSDYIMDIRLTDDPGGDLFGIRF